MTPKSTQKQTPGHKLVSMFFLAWLLEFYHTVVLRWPLTRHDMMTMRMDLYIHAIRSLAMYDINCACR